MSRRLWELQILTALSCRVGPLKESCSRVFEVWVFWNRGLELESGDSGFEVWGSSLWMSGSLDVRSSWFGGLWMSSPARSTAMGRRTASAVSFAFFFCFYSVCWSCEVFGGGAKVGAEAELCRQEGGAPLGRVVGPPLGRQLLVVTCICRCFSSLCSCLSLARPCFCSCPRLFSLPSSLCLFVGYLCCAGTSPVGVGL